MSSEQSREFKEELIQNLLAFKRKFSRRHGKRLFPVVLPSVEASARLAQLDIEKYGVAKVKFSGTREKPFFSTTSRLTLQAGDFPIILSETLDMEQKLSGLNGGGLSIIELEDSKYTPEELMRLTEHLVNNRYLEFFTYNRKVTYCTNCKKSWLGILHKCPSCGSMSTLTKFNRFAST